MSQSKQELKSATDWSKRKAEIREARLKAGKFEERDELGKTLDVLEEAWSEANKAADLKACAPVAKALEMTQKAADDLAFSILYSSDITKVTGEQLKADIARFRAFEHIRMAFEPTTAEAMHEQVVGGINKAFDSAMANPEAPSEAVGKEGNA